MGFGVRLLRETILEGLDSEGAQMPGTHLGSHIPTLGPRLSSQSFPPFSCLRMGTGTCTSSCGFEEQSSWCVCCQAEELRQALCPREFWGWLGRARPLPVCGRMCVCIFAFWGCSHVFEACGLAAAALCMCLGGPPGTFWPPTGPQASPRGAVRSH